MSAAVRVDGQRLSTGVTPRSRPGPDILNHAIDLDPDYPLAAGQQRVASDVVGGPVCSEIGLGFSGPAARYLAAGWRSLVCRVAVPRLSTSNAPLSLSTTAAASSSFPTSTETRTRPVCTSCMK